MERMDGWMEREEGRKEVRKKGREEERKEGRKEGREEGREYHDNNSIYSTLVSKL